MKSTSILKSPILTEKANVGMQEGNKYTFLVGDKATKGQIKESIESLYGVKVLNVNSLKNRGKIKRSMVGKRSPYVSSDKKKAIVQIEEGKTLKIYEGGKK